MPKADPKTPIRRERFRAVCEAKKWRNEDGTWKITQIAEATKKARNKVSDLLNKGSFGAQIARQLEDALGLGEFYLDGVDREEPRQRELHVEESAATYSPIRPPTVAEALEALAERFMTMDPVGRQLAASMLANLPTNPAAHATIAAALEAVFASNKAVVGQPAAPAPAGAAASAGRTRSTATSAQAKQATARSRLFVRFGDGNENQQAFPLTVVDDPFSASPDQRELELYQRIESAPKGPGGE